MKKWIYRTILFGIMSIIMMVKFIQTKEQIYLYVGCLLLIPYFVGNKRVLNELNKKSKEKN